MTRALIVGGIIGALFSLVAVLILSPHIPGYVAALIAAVGTNGGLALGGEVQLRITRRRYRSDLGI